MNKKVLILASIAFFLVAGLGLLLSSGRDSKPTPASPTPVPSVFPSPTPDLLASADRELLTRLSTELAVKYRSFTSVNRAYLDSIRPYLTKQFFEDYRGTLRYADRAPFFQPVKSTAKGTKVSGNSVDGVATATVKLRSTDLQNQKPFDQTLRIDWKRFGQRWSATDINAVKFDKE